MKNSLLRTQFKLISIFIIALITSCEKPEDGELSNDNKNVKSRTFNNSTWLYNSPHYYLDLSVPELTTENINSAAVLVYFSVVDGYWRAVPFTEYTSSSNYFMNFTANEGNVRVIWTYNSITSSGDNPNKFYGTTVKFKVVVVPANAALKKVDYDNYEEVKKVFQLEDTTFKN